MDASCPFCPLEEVLSSHKDVAECAGSASPTRLLAITIARLLKTRSGKILRDTMKKIADGTPWTMPATIDDPAILDEIGSALKGKGVVA
jgi:acyl-coenzyme A synthetase/AMP-(fatty) acid ligase